MAAVELTSNLKLITSGNVPTTSTLANGEVAFGMVGGFAKMYGNVNNVIVDLSNFLRTAPVTSVAGKTGVVTLTKADVGLSEVNNTSDVSKNVHGAYTFLGKDTRNVNSPPSFYLNGGIATCTYEFKQSSVIGIPTGMMDNTYCYLETFIPWYDASGGYPIQVAMQNSTAGIPKMIMRCGVNANTWSAWTPMSPGGGSTPYKTTISSWSGAVGNYTSTISASTHGKGTDPQVETFIGTTRYYDDYDIATNGDITFRSSANISLNIKIR